MGAVRKGKEETVGKGEVRCSTKFLVGSYLFFRMFLCSLSITEMEAPWLEMVFEEKTLAQF